MRFSQRMGIVPVTKIFQIDQMDDELRNRLWNMAEKYFFTQMIKKSFGKDSNVDIFYVKLWEGFFKKTIDSISPHYSNARGQLKIYFFEFTWYMVYDFIEYIALLESSITQFSNF